jgi:NAD-dependent deacetylase
MPNIVILTGAGCSVESGITTFRDSNGLWENHRIEDVASPAGFRKNPNLVHKFYNARRAQLQTVEPNAAHYALAKLEQEWEGNGSFLLISQNVDNLHERAGSVKLIHMHGELTKIRCTDCGKDERCVVDVTDQFICTSCSKIGTMRPDIVWFGEVPFGLRTISDYLMTADIFVSIGTSGVVAPASLFVEQVLQNGRGCRTIEINPNPTIEGYFGRVIAEPATVGVPKLVEDLIEEY